MKNIKILKISKRKGKQTSKNTLNTSKIAKWGEYNSVERKSDGMEKRFDLCALCRYSKSLIEKVFGKTAKRLDADICAIASTCNVSSNTSASPILWKIKIWKFEELAFTEFIRYFKTQPTTFYLEIFEMRAAKPRKINMSVP